MTPKEIVELLTILADEYHTSIEGYGMGYSDGLRKAARMISEHCL